MVNQPTRQGAWLDSLVFSEVSDPYQAVAQLQSNNLDIYANSVAESTLFQTVLEDQDLTFTQEYGSYTELTFNPYGPTFKDGRLNPFSIAKIRQAMNWLIDRDKIAQEIYGGLAIPKYLPLTHIEADYTRFKDTVDALETQYTYNFSLAETRIVSEMLSLGAIRENGTWYFNSEPVTIIFIIRVEDQRRGIGDYVSDQLEAIGFEVDRQYKTRDEASPIWNQSDPAEGLWHIYTGGWINTNINRDDASNFGYFYTPLGPPSPLWQAYHPTSEFLSISTELWNNNFSSLEERGIAFEQALSLAMADSGQGTEGAGSIRVWLVDSKSFTPRRADTLISSHMVGGVAGSAMFPFVARFNGVEGGSLRVAQPGFLIDPWNPIAGSAWIYDTFPILSTAEQGTMPDPITGLYLPMRIESADCVVKEGTPISKTLDWVSLSFAPSITIPLDTWVDWDAVSQTFITLGEVTTPTLEANTKCTIAYPADLFTTITWHDGSPLTVGDFILRMILQFDRAKPNSAIYDESAVPVYEAFMSHFRGVKIESVDPLVITTYDDMRNYLDIELIAAQETWWPGYGFLGTSPGSWHNLTPAVRGEAAGQIAFSSDKAGQLGVEWTNFIGGPSLGILQTWMDLSAGENYIPYTPTLSEYITPDEATARWAALQAWYTTYHHFWLGTGPFFVSQVSYNPKSLILAHFDDYPDVAGRWDAFTAAAQPVLEINHPSGAPGSYFNLTGSGFPPGSQAFVVSNNQILAQLQVDEGGAISVTLSTDNASPGEYHLRITVNPSAGVLLSLDAEQPTWPREGEFQVIRLPVIFEIRMPMVNKN
jgi:peptide/nickel transport system substrate-binding protein